MKLAIRPVLCLILLISTLAATAAAQKKPVAANKLTALKVTGSTAYSEKEILAASGLVMGQIAANGDFQEAVQRLGDSGMFSDVSYSYSSSAAGMRLEIRLADVDPSMLVPARFENFVWFTDDELRADLLRRVPLFKQTVPLTGNLADHVSEALQAMLSDRRLPGKVDFLREAKDQNGGSLVAIVYRVAEVNILIHGFEFPGASTEQAALLASAASRTLGGSYTRSGLGAVARLDLLPVYLQRGYLRAEFAPANARVVPQPATGDAEGPPEILVDAIIAVTPGKVYSTSGVDWSGNLSIPASELTSLLHLKIGQPADALRLREDVKSIGKLYRSRGYMTEQTEVKARLDNENDTVRYEIAVAEGALYKMGELEITGLNTQVAGRIRAAWTLREGQPYNADYPAKFRADTGNLLPRGERWNITSHETLNAKDKTVDVELRFKRE